MTATILLTGYEPFDQFPYNPSGAIAQALDGWEPAPGYVVRGAVMPVDCEKMPGVLAGLLQDHRPAFVVGLGLAAGATAIRVERIGHNWLEITRPDNGGHVRDGVPILPGAPAAYFSSLPVKELVTGLLEEDIPAYLSDHAGTHLCNHMLFLALHHAAVTRSHEFHSGFLHLPATPELVARLTLSDPAQRHTPSMSLNLLTEGVKLTLTRLTLA